MDGFPQRHFWYLVSHSDIKAGDLFPTHSVIVTFSGCSKVNPKFSVLWINRAV